MRLRTILATCLLAILTSATSTPNASSCVRLPITGQIPGGTPIPDRYAVELLPNYTLEEHFRTINLNLTELVEFYYFPPDYYFVNANSTVINDLIRCDPGVKSVEQDYRLDWFPQPDSSPLKSRSLNTSSCVRKPIIVHEGFTPMPDSYVIELLPNYTLEEHFQTIDLNLTGFDEFNYFPPDTYFVKVNSTVMDDFIRCDSGIKSIQQNFFQDIKVQKTRFEYPDESTSLKKRSSETRVQESIERTDQVESPDPIRTWEEERVPGEWPMQIIESVNKVGNLGPWHDSLNPQRLPYIVGVSFQSKIKVFAHIIAEST